MGRARSLALASLLVAAPLAASAPAKPVLPWIEDDYATALSKARAKRVPIFADVWAPWCHTCRTMRAFVFTDKALAKHAGQFVWLSIDTEKAQNAPFSKKYPIRAWPSFYVIDPQKETIVLRWVGGATVGQLEKIFADGTRTVQGGGPAAGTALAEADRLYGEGKYSEAAPAYRDALRLLKPGAPQYARAVESLLFCFQSSKAHAECAALAREALPALRHTTSAANLAGSGLDCAVALPADAPGRAEAVAAFEADARAVLSDPRLRIAADDRSALFSSIHDAREDAKDAEGARKIARAWVADLDGLAARSTPEQRTALDPDRLGAYEAAEEIEKAIPMLEASEREFPEDYNPPARLAYVDLHLKKYDEGLAASDRALAKVYGPRKVRVLLVRADIFRGKGDVAAAKKVLADALAFADVLPPGQRDESTVASLKKRLEAPDPDAQ